MRVGPIPSAHGVACIPAPGCWEMTVFAPEAGSSAVTAQPASELTYIAQTNSKIPAVRRGKEKTKQTTNHKQNKKPTIFTEPGWTPPSSARSPRGAKEISLFKKD